MNPLRAWNAFWFRPVSARPLGLFRVLFGLCALAHLALLVPDLDHWLTDHGVMQGPDAREIAGPLRPSPLQWVQDPASVRGFVAATAAAAALFTLGWQTRVMGVLLYLGLLSIHHRNIPTNCGPDNLLMAFAFLLTLSPCGAAYSLDARRARLRRGGTPAEPLIVPWAQRLIQLQTCLVYLDTAVLKCNGATWLGGTALHFVLQNPEVGARLDLSALTLNPLLINALTHAALFVEFALAFLLWFRATRAWAVAAGLALHVGVLFTINVPLFGEMMVASYLAFLSPEELTAFPRALDPRGRLRARRPSPVVISGRVDPAEARPGPHTPPSAEVPAEIPSTADAGRASGPRRS